MNGTTRRLLSGAAGAAALTTIHQAGRYLRPDLAPRYRTLAGDLIANASYYSAIPGASPRATWNRAVVFGLAAGLGAYFRPSRMNLGATPNSEHVSNAIMTVAWYLTGALAAAACAEALRSRPAHAYFRAREDAYRRHQADRL